ncbi:hypothetical protein DH2020_029854 [Rehmannia glutinosa]|uniref:Uncharacterized protein n=1 Tax=Rehmannia glutinosa TaxID=99300 RepID=A0ABR0VMF3_REHGL
MSIYLLDEDEDKRIQFPPVAIDGYVARTTKATNHCKKSHKLMALFGSTSSFLQSSLFPATSIPHSSLFFTLNGKPLSDSTPLLQNSQIAPLSTLTLHLRFLGGGGDGGATGAESRDCYLNMYAVKKPDKVDPNEMRLSKWLNCSLSNEPLRHPIVIDKLGNLFNKEALVEGLLKKNLPKEFGYIKGIRGSDKIVINGTEEEVTELWEKLKEEKLKVKDNGKENKEAEEWGCERRGVGRLTGTKHGIEGNGINGNAKGSAKKFKAADIAPANATKAVYRQFSPSRKSDFKETYSCRSLPLGGTDQLVDVRWF